MTVTVTEKDYEVRVAMLEAVLETLIAACRAVPLKGSVYEIAAFTGAYCVAETVLEDSEWSAR